MLSKHLTILICFNIALGFRFQTKIFNNVQEDFVRLDGEAGSNYPSFNSINSQDKEIMNKQITCGKPAITPNTDLRIMGGEEAKPNSWPWQVRIQDLRDKTFKNLCGGTIISATKIVSVANCFFDKETGKKKQLNSFQVVAGLHSLNDIFPVTTNSQTMKVFKVNTPFENYPKDGSNENDIAIVHIRPPGFTFNDMVQPACLPTSPVPVGTNCYATGWGNQSPNEPNGVSKLRQVKLPIISQSNCTLWLDAVIQDTKLCAGYPEGGKDTCNGDNGGPLVCHLDGVWTLYGVLGSDSGCGEPKHPGVYSSVYRFRTWIRTN